MPVSKSRKPKQESVHFLGWDQRERTKTTEFSDVNGNIPVAAVHVNTKDVVQQNRDEPQNKKRLHTTNSEVEFCVFQNLFSVFSDQKHLFFAKSQNVCV